MTSNWTPFEVERQSTAVLVGLIGELIGALESTFRTHLGADPTGSEPKFEFFWPGIPSGVERRILGKVACELGEADRAHLVI
jgi:hypothetical protein